MEEDFAEVGFRAAVREEMEHMIAKESNMTVNALTVMAISGVLAAVDRRLPLAPEFGPRDVDSLINRPPNSEGEGVGG